MRIETGEASIFIDPWTNKAAFDGDWPRPIVPITASTKRRAVLITHEEDRADPLRHLERPPKESPSARSLRESGFPSYDGGLRRPYFMISSGVGL